MNWLSQDELSEARVGDLSEYEGGEIRGLRVGIVGTINFDKPWVYTLFGATNAFDKGFNEEELDSFTLFDWRLDIPFFKNSVMSIGKQKEPISGERIQSMLFNHMQERTAVADALMPSRNVGIVWNGSSPNKYSSWAFGVFNDWFDADQDFDESASQYIGRLTWAPLRSEDDSNLVHLGLGCCRLKIRRPGMPNCPGAKALSGWHRSTPAQTWTIPFWGTPALMVTLLRLPGYSLAKCAPITARAAHLGAYPFPVRFIKTARAPGNSLHGGPTSISMTAW